MPFRNGTLKVPFLLLSLYPSIFISFYILSRMNLSMRLRSRRAMRSALRLSCLATTSGLGSRDVGLSMSVIVSLNVAEVCQDNPDEMYYEDKLGCARGIVYALGFQGVLLGIGMLCWRLLIH